MKEIDKVALIRIEDGSILTTKSKGKFNYYIPGGKREAGESDEDTLCREILEELSVRILPATIKYVGTFNAPADGHPPGTFVKMTCYQADFAGVLKADNEIEEIRWLRYDDIALVAEVDKIIFSFLNQRGSLM